MGRNPHASGGGGRSGCRRSARRPRPALTCYESKITELEKEIETLKKAKFWVKELQKHASATMTIALVGNKSDLEEQREVTREEAEEYVAEVGEGMFYMETSAKTASNVNELFAAIAENLSKA